MTGRRRHSWSDHGWPVLAGVVTATGLASAYLSLGWSMTAFLFVFAAVTVAILTVSLLGERGELTLIDVVRPALYAGAAMVVTMGLIAWLRAWAFVVVALVVVGSPALRSRLGRLFDPGPAPRDESGDETPDETRRRFDEIVAQELAGLDDDEDR